MGYYYRHWKYQKGNKGILGTASYTWIWKFWWNGPMFQKNMKYHILPNIQDNLNNSRIIKEIESVILKLLKKIFRPDDFIGEFCQTFKEELTIILYNSSRKWKRKKCFPIHFMKPVISWSPKQIKTIQHNLLLNINTRILSKILGNRI